MSDNPQHFNLVNVVLGFVGAAGLGYCALIQSSASAFFWFVGFWLLWALVAMGIGNQDASDRLHGWAKALPNLYDTAGKVILRRLAEAMKPPHAEDPPLPKGRMARLSWYLDPKAASPTDVGRLMANPWSWPVLSTALAIALFYPVFFGVGHWALSSSASDFGNIPMFPAEAPMGLRIAAFCYLVVLLGIKFLSLVTCYNFLRQLSQLLSIAFVIPVAVGSVSAIQGAYAIAIAFAFGGTRAVAFLVAVTGSFAVAKAIALTLPAAAICAVVASFILVNTVSRSTLIRFGVFGYLNLVCVTVTGLIIYALSDFATIGYTGSLVILVLLPCINAIFDWLSYGLSIYLIRKGYEKKKGWPFALAIVDGIAALILLPALACSFVIILSIIDTNRTEPIFGISTLLSDLAKGPAGNWWLILMVCSTLVPTLLHVVFGIFSVVTWIPLKIWERLFGTLARPKDTYQALGVSVLITGVTAVYALIPVEIFYWLLPWIGVGAGIYYDQVANLLLRVNGWFL